jgi:hypothetical protein
MTQLTDMFQITDTQLTTELVSEAVQSQAQWAFHKKYLRVLGRITYIHQLQQELQALLG